MEEPEAKEKPMSMIGVAVAGFLIGVIAELIWDYAVVRGLSRRYLGWPSLPPLGVAYPYMLLAAGIAGSIACTVGIHEIEHSKPNRIGPRVASVLGFVCLAVDVFLRLTNRR